MKRLALGMVLLVGSACASSDERIEDEAIERTASALTTVASFGTNPAQLKMHKVVPKDMPSGPRPLVVVLHGCTQTPATYESAGWTTLAEAWKFYVVYPEQNTQKNNSSGCFNWGGRWKSAPSAFVLQAEPLDLGEIARGKGENQSIKEMVDKMKADHAIDPKRVFVTGLSAGGAMTSVLLATWPDVFSAGAIFAGVPYGCATDKKTTAEAAACLKDYSGTNAYLARTPEAWGALVKQAAPSFAGPWPRVSIWHGTSDFVVHSNNQRELVKQWTAVHGIDQTADAKDTVSGAAHEVHKDGSGKVVVETYTIQGQGHGTEVAPNEPIDPAQPSGPKCGKAAAYIVSAGICSTYHVGKFFGLDGAGTTGPEGSGTDGGGGGGSSSSGGGASSGGASSSGKGGGGEDLEPGNHSTCSASEAPRFRSPEPTSLGLIFIAGIGLWRRRRSAERARA